MLLEGCGSPVSRRVPHVDSIRYVEPGLLARVLDQSDGSARTTFGHQLRAQCRVEHDQDTPVGGRGEAWRWLQRQGDLVRQQRKFADLNAAVVQHAEIAGLQGRSDAVVVPAVFGPQQLRVAFSASTDGFAEFLGVLDALDIELIADQRSRPVWQLAECR